MQVIYVCRYYLLICKAFLHLLIAFNIGIMYSKGREKNTRINNLNSFKNKPIDGTKNWLIVMILLFSTGLVLDNYNRFGIIKSPLEIIYCLFGIINQHWWLFWTTLICFFLQIAQTFLVEKLLVLDLISEKRGMILHALNVFFLPTVFTVLARISDANPIVARLFSSCNMFVMAKIWSYAFINSKYRQVFREQTSKDTNGDIAKLRTKYPCNVTASNIIEYMVFTPPIQYQFHFPQRTKPDWKTFGRLCLQQFLVLYATIVLTVQFLLPELYLLRSKEDESMMTMRTFSCILRIIVPLNLVWLLYAYIHTYRIYLPAYAALTGMKDITFSKDWWNSENVEMFWRKWNLPVHYCLKYNVVIPLLRIGYSKTLASLVAFGIAGIIHEYLNSLPFGVYNGMPFLMTISEIPAGYISAYISRKIGNSYGNILLWAYMIIAHCVGITSYAFILPHFVVKDVIKNIP